MSNLILWSARMLIFEWKNKNVLLYTSPTNWLADSKRDKLISLRPAYIKSWRRRDDSVSSEMLPGKWLGARTHLTAKCSSYIEVVKKN